MRRRELHFNSAVDLLDEAWRTAGDDPVRSFDLDQLAGRAILAEQGLMDAMFMADFYGAGGPGFCLEPVTTMAALAEATSRIGLIASVSTTYNEPYDVAAMFASIEHLSAGRAGWNMVTTAADKVSSHYSRTRHLEHDLRYERAQEFVELVSQLWAGLPPSQDTQFGVQCPLPIPLNRGGQVVRSQAGVSGAGRDFGARWADVIFTAQPTAAAAQEFYADMNARARNYGRGADSLRILPALLTFVAESEFEARELLEADLDRRSESTAGVENLVGIRLRDLPADEPIPLDKLPALGSSNAMSGRRDLFLNLIRSERLTPRQVVQQVQLTWAGTPAQIADHIAAWFVAEACDGFTLLWKDLNSNELFVHKVIPLLQERGLYRTAYTGATLREHLGFSEAQSR